MRCNRLMMMVAVAVAVSAYAQTLNVTSSSSSVRPGQSVNLTYFITGQQTPVVAAFQFDEALNGTTETNRVSVVVGKDLYCSNTGLKCVVVGLNSTPIPNGTVLTSTLTVPTSMVGPATVKLSGVVAADGNGISTLLDAGPDLSIAVLQREDLNGDGKVDIMDVTISVFQVLGGTCIPGADLNGDGKCDILDVQIVAKAAR